MTKIFAVSFSILLVIFGIAVHAAVVHSLWEAMLVFFVAGGAHFLTLSTAREYGERYATGLVGSEMMLLEYDEVYELMGVVKIDAGYPYNVVAVLRLRDGEIRACAMEEKSVPTTKIFTVKRGRSGSGIEKYAYPPKS